MRSTPDPTLDVSFRTDAVLEILPDGFQVFDRAWRYVYLNQRAEQMLGRSREELLGKVCWEEYPEAVGTPFHTRYTEAMDTGQPAVFEDFCPHDKTWVEISLHPYADGLGAFTRDITARKQAEEAVRQSEERHHALFDQVLDAVLLADDNGYYVDANPAACQLFGLPLEQLRGKRFTDFSPPEIEAQITQTWHQFTAEGAQTGVFVLRRPDGTERILEYSAKTNILPGVHFSVLRDATERRAALDRTERLVADLAEERETLDTVNRIGRLLSAELNLDRLVQAATDAATELTDAEFGAFFYNVIDTKGESYLLYTISGVPREAFSRFPMPRATELFGPTFRGEAIIRIGDVLQDPRYGHMSPYHGMPKGHLPVRSYLAVPVISRSGEVLGGLFFGHSQTDVFTERAERNLLALVAQLTIAVDNARLFGDSLKATEEARSATAQALREVEERKKAEAALAREVHHAALRADVNAALAQGGTLQEMLQRCAEPLAEHLDASLARLWAVEEKDHVLVLQASAGTSLVSTEEQNRIPVGQGEIGLMAQEKRPRFTNEASVGFAGYPLLIEDRAVGVIALFADQELPADTLEELASIADALAQGVERKRVEQRLAESEMRQRTLLKDVLDSVTGGKLRLCDTADDLPVRFPSIVEPIVISERSLRVLRRATLEVAQVAGMDKNRQNDLLTAMNEAAMNAVVHAGGGIASIGLDAEKGTIQVWIEDQGRGIDMSSLPRATLDKGYTTAGTLGHGFKMVLSTVDMVWLLTGPNGTTVVLEQEREAPRPGWLERFDWRVTPAK